MELTKAREEDGTVVAHMRGNISLAQDLPLFEQVSGNAIRQDILIGIAFHQKGGQFLVHPGDGPVIASVLRKGMLRYRKAAILAVVCSDPLTFLRHHEIHKHMELPAPYGIRAFLDEANARLWITEMRQKIEMHGQIIHGPTEKLSLRSPNSSARATISMLDS